jgi:site-specific recombinase XerC
VEKGLFIEPTRLSFQDFTERWLRAYGEKNLAPKTLFRYRQILESRVYPAMGHLKIEKITPVHLMEFYANLQEKGIREDGRSGGLSERTVLHHHRLISTILQSAVQWQVTNSNPARKVKPPKVAKKQGSYYDEEQTATLLAVSGKESIKHKYWCILLLLQGCVEAK